MQFLKIKQTFLNAFNRRIENQNTYVILLAGSGFSGLVVADIDTFLVVELSELLC